MTKVPLSGQGLILNTDRVAAGSKQRQVSVVHQSESFSAQQSQPQFKREVPFTDQRDFVEVDGKKYFLSAPRGTYLNILV